VKKSFPASGFKPALVAVLMFILLGTGIVTVGTFSYKNYERNYRAEAERQLLSIADLKVSELIQYRKERLGDGAVFSRNLSFSRLVQRFFTQPADTDARRQLEIWLGKVQNYYQYSRVFLVDTQSVERLTVPAATSGLIADFSEQIKRTMQSGTVTFLDFYRHSPDQPIYLGILVPVFDESGANNPQGVLVLQIDPTTYLYPFIQRWPVPSQTAETLLVRREGDKAVFLNELRFQRDAALTLRASLGNTDLPAAKAVLGQEGIVEGLDYRGAPVLAVLKAVPDSPWFMVARQDIEEVLAPMRAHFIQVVVMIGTLLFAVAAGISLIWRQQRIRFYREKVRSAEALRESEARLRSYFESPIVGFATTSPARGWLEVNACLCDMLGYSSEELTRLTWSELTHPDDLDVDTTQFNRMLAGGIDKYSLEKRFFRKDGEILWVDMSVNCVRKPDGAVDYVVALLHNINRRKHTEQRLGEVVENLRVSNRDLEQFAYIASHDLQEPLRMVANYVQLLERRYKDKLDQDAKDFIRYAADGAIRMQALIDSLLEYSRLHTRKKPFEEVDLQKTLGRVLRDLEGRVLETGAKITVDPLPHVCGDSLQLGMVFQNFISNALKFRSKEPPEVHVAAEEFSSHWKITVSDNGIGIAPEHQERIFKIFQRLHSRSEYPGTGIGLAICHRIIERHGGKTGIESVLGKGSSFWLTLPRKGERQS